MTEDLIISEVNALPENLKVEVLHFIAFLKHKYGEKTKPAAKKERVFGRSKGKYVMAPDFDAPLDDFKDYM